MSIASMQPVIPSMPCNEVDTRSLHVLVGWYVEVLKLFQFSSESLRHQDHLEP
jgi:hypothetical protein